MPGKVSAAILAGGRSTRMGANKALLRPRPGGPTIIEMVVARLREAEVPPTLLVTNTPEEYAFLGLATVTDDVPGAGSLGGILTALNHSPTERRLVVACDMPFLSPPLIRHMASVATEADALVPRWNDGDRMRVEPLHAIYTQRCVDAIRRRIEAGKLKAQGFLEDVAAQYIEEEELRRYDPELESFRNINTPEEWNRLTDPTG